MAKKFSELRAKMSPEAQVRSAERADVTLAEIVPPLSDISEEWELEVERRLATYDRGDVQAIDAEEVFAKARQAAELGAARCGLHGDTERQTAQIKRVVRERLNAKRTGR